MHDGGDHKDGAEKQAGRRNKRGEETCGFMTNWHVIDYLILRHR